MSGTRLACETFERYLIGLDKFAILTDHKSLVPFINALDLDKVPLRCQRLLMRLMRFNPIAEYVPGSTLQITDTLSRHPVDMATSHDAHLMNEMEAYSKNVCQC